MTELYHYTGLGAALSILDTLWFVPRYRNPLAADSGLNCFAAGQPHNTNQHIEGNGAKITFLWDGPIMEDAQDLALPYPSNVLLHQGAWRSIVPFGTNAHLRIAKIHAEDGAWEAYWKHRNKWPLFFAKRRIGAFRSDVEDRLAEMPSVSVGKPPTGS